MQTDQDAIRNIIAKILMEVSREGGPPSGEVKNSVASGVHDTIDQAVEAAVEAQKRLIALSLDSRKKIINAIRKVVSENNEKLSVMAVRETKLGRVEDKIRENLLCIEKTPGVEDIVPSAVSGDSGLTLLEFAPVGVIGALTPVTNATGTLIHNSISMIAAGNAVIFNPHPSARNTSLTVVEMFHEAMVRAGGPPGLVGMVSNPNLETADQLIHHPKVNMLVATGGKNVVQAVLSSGKKAIGAGAGNPPALVDETANLRQAAKDIVNGHSINNNIFCICEKEVIAVDEIADTLIKFMQETGKAFLLNPEQAKKVTALVVKPDGHVNGKYIGKDIQIILKDAGIEVNDKVRCAIFEASKDHPLVWLEQMMPVLPIVRVKDVWEGVAFGVQVEQGNRHTAIMHSTNVEHLTAFARAVQSTIFVKNGPCYSGIGLGGEGHTSFTIAGPTGEGLTTARSFTRQRRCVLVDSFRII